METRVAIAAIIVENPDSVAPLNELLHEYSRYIIGRMGIPYKEKGISHHQYRHGRAAGCDQRADGKNRTSEGSFHQDNIFQSLKSAFPPGRLAFIKNHDIIHFR